MELGVDDVLEMRREEVLIMEGLITCFDLLLPRAREGDTSGEVSLAALDVESTSANESIEDSRLSFACDSVDTVVLTPTVTTSTIAETATASAASACVCSDSDVCASNNTTRATSTVRFTKYPI